MAHIHLFVAGEINIFQRAPSYDPQKSIGIVPQDCISDRALDTLSGNKEEPAAYFANHLFCLDVFHYADPVPKLEGGVSFQEGRAVVDRPHHY